jgi:oligopeptide/dipeptide ABC transporter ATP-binding protein
MTPLIELRDVTKTFTSGVLGRERKVALERFSFSVDAEQPTITAVVGESGSGKTTLARLLLGLIQPTEGQVLYRGQKFETLKASDKRDFRHHVQAIFQDPYEVYNPFYRVDHVLTTPVRKFRLARSAADGRARIEEALRAVGLQPEEILGRYPHQLSGGQRQRIMVARALLLRPRLIVADEPVSMVDASLRATILGSLRRLRDEMGISILYITHDLTTAYQVADSIVVLSPQHPYTQLLLGSVPRVTTTRDWGTESVQPQRSIAATACKFADRCPSAMEKCLTTTPPLFQSAPNHAVACFLQESRATT